MNKDCGDKHERIVILEEVVFGNPKTGDKGMKQKVDEMHDILTQFKGVKGLFGMVLLVSSVLVALKMWLFSK